MSALDRFTRECCAIARRAGKAILEVYAGSFTVEQKADHSPLTAADLAAHRIIVAALAELAPEIPVLSEESKALPWAQRSAWQRYWLVDPLDGTREFVKRNGEFTVNIALIEDHVPILGVVLAPVSGELCYGVAGMGAFLEAAPGGLPQPIATRRASAVPVVAGSRSHGGERQAAVLANLGAHTLVAVGSSLKFCMVARGQADLYLRLGPTSEWDTAAAQCVVEQAGGAVVDLQGAPLRYNTKDSLLNPEFLTLGDGSIDWLQRLGLRT
ncbi:MAG TPA: 3'(2'),5'-bisphosphate nucleotidase CysQ [Rhodanobacteraceae bacterium]